MSPKSATSEIEAIDRSASSTRMLVEELLARLGASAGHWRVTINAKDGYCLNVDVAEIKIPATTLSRFDP